MQYQQHAVRAWEQAPDDKDGLKNLEATSGSMNHSLVAKLNRTDTTLDLSQKAEKGMLMLGLAGGTFTWCCSAGWGVRGTDGNLPRGMEGHRQTQVPACL